MVAIAPRVTKLEDTVEQHHVVLFGTDGCPDDGLVSRQKVDHKELMILRDLVKEQVIYNKEIVEVAKLIRTAVILAIIGAVLALVIK